MFHIIEEVIGHDNSPIRAIGVGPLEDIVTGAQDCTMKRFIFNNNNNNNNNEELELLFHDNITGIFHNHWVTAITTLMSSTVPELFPNGIIVTGSMDKLIRIFDGLTNNLLITLEGHEKGIISFSWLIHNNSIVNLISGSWDGTARIWNLNNIHNNKYECIHILKGHENGVCVLGIQSLNHIDFDIIITTSTGEAINNTPQNFQIRFWNSNTGHEININNENNNNNNNNNENNNKFLRIKDHNGPIRSICGISGAVLLSNNNNSMIYECTFMTSSNDGTIKIRTLQYGINNNNNNNNHIILKCECIATLLHPTELSGTNPFILNCTTNHVDNNNINNNIILTSGEDGSVLVWNSFSYELIQAIQHPTSIWCSIPLINNNNLNEIRFVTAGHDGKLRIFSNSMNITEKQLLLQNKFNKEVNEYLFRKNKGPTNEEIEKAPKWDNRFTTPGKSDQQVCVFNKNGSLIAAQWSLTSNTWIEIGVVTGTGDGGELNGKQYDHIMPVEMDTAHGVQTLQLGYNNGENPFSVAKRFVDENGLDTIYIQQIADWIISKQGNTNNNVLDISNNNNNNKINEKIITSNHFPLLIGILYDDIPNKIQFQKLIIKIESLNNEILILSSNNNLLEITKENINDLNNLCDILQNKSHFHNNDLIQWNNIKFIIIKLCTLWILSDNNNNNNNNNMEDIDNLIISTRIPFIFPGFDLLRMLSCHTSGITLLTDSIYDIHITKLLLISINVLIKAETSKNGVINNYFSTILCILRFLTNGLKSLKLNNKILFIINTLSLEKLQELFNVIKEYAINIQYNMNIHLAACNFLLNLSIYFHQNNVNNNNNNIDIMLLCFNNLLYILHNITTFDNGSYNNDIIYKIGIGIGTIFTLIENRKIIYNHSNQILLLNNIKDMINTILMKLLNSGINGQNSHTFECYNDLQQLF